MRERQALVVKAITTRRAPASWTLALNEARAAVEYTRARLCPDDLRWLTRLPYTSRRSTQRRPRHARCAGTLRVHPAAEDGMLLRGPPAPRVLPRPHPSTRLPAPPRGRAAQDLLHLLGADRARGHRRRARQRRQRGPAEGRRSARWALYDTDVQTVNCGASTTTSSRRERIVRQACRRSSPIASSSASEHAGPVRETGSSMGRSPAARPR